jgi:hypothetical protein
VERVPVTELDLEVKFARLEERIVAADRALSVATQELHRRLEMLNGEASRLREMQASYIPRETYDRGVDAIEKATRSMESELDRRLKVLETGAANMQGRTWVGGAIVLIIASVIAVAVPMLLKGGP